jgi:mannose-6-phosphate isomerase class I
MKVPYSVVSLNMHALTCIMSINKNLEIHMHPQLQLAVLWFAHAPINDPTC